ncbi:Arc family DNA-binding protein [Paraburkholderia sp. SARCC-3016]|uniref:Arc family DNA-binding protein n=1 Tax=Paraburkholderia sp. SARCC-3016 TaxID=3058611 RepID=UPI002809EF05|nr:Arc family DNA-binding protein [Paraburkholderia sp. SARCC-3016]MDQ7975905.1 Arc family DNA-binding protein [Paraburkholderia sp. SARCC-3016]
MARDEPQVNLRIPAALKDRLDKASDRNKRSLTAEIVARLEESFSKDPAPVTQVDPYTLDLFAEKVGQVLDEREKKRAKR